MLEIVRRNEALPEVRVHHVFNSVEERAQRVRVRRMRNDMNTFKTSFFITTALMTERVTCRCRLEVSALPWVRTRAVEMVVEM